MKAYLLTTCTLFVLLTVVHVWRAVVESTVIRDPWFILMTILTAGLSVWAFRLLRQAPRSSHT